MLEVDDRACSRELRQLSRSARRRRDRESLMLGREAECGCWVQHHFSMKRNNEM